MPSLFFMLVALFFVGDLLWLWRIPRRIPHQPWLGLAIAFVAFQIVGLSMVLFGRFVGLRWDVYLPRPALSLVFIWHLLFIVPWLLTLAVIALGKGMAAVARWFSGSRRRPATTGEGVSRREFLTASVTLAPAVLSAAGALASEPQLESFRVDRKELALPTLPPQLDGLTLVHVSDVHIGRFTRDRVLTKISDEVNALKGDLVLMTGDLINISLDDLPAGIELMKSLRGKHGTYLCEGNHDLFENPETFRRNVDKAGLSLLRDAQVTLPINGMRLQLLGLPWAHGDMSTKDAVLRLNREIDEQAFRILLAHHPHAFDFAENIPLTLAGHTHGGQIMVNQEIGFGPLIFRYWSGIYRRKERAMVVSNGVGNWFPLRINAPAEITHLTLRRG